MTAYWTKAERETWRIRYGIPEISENDEMRRISFTMDALEKAATFKRNSIIRDSCDFKGNWIAVPEDDFDRLRTLLAALGKP